MRAGTTIAILGIWGAVATSSMYIGGGAVIMAGFALFATLILATLEL